MRETDIYVMDWNNLSGWNYAALAVGALYIIFIAFGFICDIGGDRKLAQLQRQVDKVEEEKVDRTDTPYDINIEDENDSTHKHIP